MSGCPNCTKAYSLKAENRRCRLPLLLHCGHTLCSACIAALYGKKGARDYIKCFYCGGKTPYDPSLSPEDQLFADTLTLGGVVASHLNLKHPREKLVEKFSNSAQTQQVTKFEESKSLLEDNPKCAECRKKAEWKCVQCGGFFCEECFQKVHSHGSFLRTHTYIPAYQAGMPVPTCSAHPSLPLSYYCSSEASPVCSDCAVLSHKHCSVITISEAAKAHRADVQQLIRDARNTVTSMKTKKQELGSQLKDTQQAAISCCQCIEQQMRDLHMALQQREHALHKELTRVVDHEIKALMAKDTALSVEMSTCSSKISTAAEMVKSDVKLMTHADQLCKSLTEIKDAVIQDQPKITLYNFTLSPNVKTAVCEAGNIQASKPPTDPPEANGVEDSLDLSQAKLFVPHTSSSPTPASIPSLSPSPPPPFSLKPDPEKSVRSSLSPLAQAYTPKKSSSRGSSLMSDRSFSRSRTPSPVPPVRREDTVSVWVSHIESPGEFYVQFKEEEDALQKMLENLNEHHSRGLCGELTVPNITEDMKVAAKFEDDLWYRAEIVSCNLSPPPAYVSVFYLDYGNSDNLPLNQVAELPSSFADGPFFAQKCKFSGIKPPSKFSNVAPPSWSPNAVTQFKNFVNGDEDNILMKEYSCKDGCKEIELFTASISDNSLHPISGKLLHMGLASKAPRSAPQHKNPPSDLPSPSSSSSPPRALSPTPLAASAVTEVTIPPPPLPPFSPDPTPVTISFCLSPTSFYIQLVSNEDVLKSLAKKLQSQKRHIIHSPYKGLVCTAQSLSDKNYYRAVVDNIGGDDGMILVRYADYGNNELVKRVWELDPDLAAIPAQAIHCTLDNITPKSGTSWPRMACEKFIADACRKVLLMEVCREGQPLPVKLTDRETKQPLHSLLVVENMARYMNMAQEYTPKTKKKKKNKKQPSPENRSLKSPCVNGFLSVGQTMECIVVQIVSVEEFFVQPVTYASEIQPLLTSIPASQPSKPNWDPEELCLAPFNGEKGRWFRGKVLAQKSRETYAVGYLDFGNTAVLPARDLAILPPSLSSYQPQAVKACLYGVTDKALSFYFSSLVLEKRVTATVQANKPGTGTSDSPVPLSLSVNGSNVASLLGAHVAASHYPLPDTSIGSLSGVSEEEEVVVEEVVESGEALHDQPEHKATGATSLLCSPKSPKDPPPPLTNGTSLPHTPLTSPPTGPTTPPGPPPQVPPPKVPQHMTPQDLSPHGPSAELHVSA